MERRIGTKVESERIYVNEQDDYVEVCVEDANYLDRFIRSYQEIKDAYEEAQKQLSAAEKEHEGNNIEAMTAMSRIHVAFSEKGCKLIDGLFGEGTVRKYFHKMYESDSNFLPGIMCFEDFFSQITPVVGEVFGKSIEEYMSDKQAERKSKMDKYQPQDHKKAKK